MRKLPVIFILVTCLSLPAWAQDYNSYQQEELDNQEQQMQAMQEQQAAQQMRNEQQMDDMRAQQEQDQWRQQQEAREQQNAIANQMGDY